MMATTQILVGDMREQLRALPDNSLDSCACDPPYELGFMGHGWDKSGIAYDAAAWAEVLRVLKPGGHLVAFGGTRTFHRLASGIEDAGFEIRDQLAWAYGSGFPKSQNVSKMIDKAKGVEGSFGEAKSAAHQGWIDRGRMRGEEGHEGYQRPWMEDEQAVSNAARQYLPGSPEAQQFNGYGTALKPSWEPICLARKPLSEKSIAANVLKWGTGALNIDGCRIGIAESDPNHRLGETETTEAASSMFGINSQKRGSLGEGRWPANLCHDGSDEVVAGFPKTESGVMRAGTRRAAQDGPGSVCYGTYGGNATDGDIYGDSGSAARFFYCAKAGKLDRLGSTHPTVKPVELMRWLVRLVTPAGGTVLDPFAGTGSTGIAAFVEGFDSILVELREEAAADIQRRLDHIRGLGRMTALEMAQVDACEQKTSKAQGADLPLFGVAL